jgi:peptidoglycan/xylan/chitin deacetylase (PgdA/CDA1 family)
MKKERVLVHIIANAVILCALVTLFVFCMPNGAVGVISTSAHKPIYRANGTEPAVALLFNVEGGSEHIEDILNILDLSGAKATFFISGAWAASNVALLQKISAAGHELGNRGYHGHDLRGLTTEQIKAEIEKNHRFVRAVTGTEMTLAIPPHGNYSPSSLSAVSSLGYRTVMWSKDTMDTSHKDADTVFKIATTGTQSGDFILMHPTAHTASALARILQFYNSAGIKTSTISSLLML